MDERSTKHRTWCRITMNRYALLKVWGALIFMVVSFQGFSQVTVSGTVKDEGGSALPGVNIVEKGTTNGVTSDAYGSYNIQVNSDAVLVFSFIGYLSQEVRVGQQTTINMTLEPNVTELSEVVVVGYGVQKKSDLTGAVSVADPTELQKQASNDVTQMLQGRVAGVSVMSDGQPGATPSVRVRGVATFGLGSGAEPLYVVDGFPLSGGIRDINPNDIETMQVLKDATAGAIYGDRAANGVVIITTKKGRGGQAMSVGINSYYGFQKTPQRIPVLDAKGYQTVNNELLTNAGAALIPGNDPSSPDYINNVNTNWQDAGYKDGYITDNNVGITGGSDKTTYYFSLDYLDNVGTLVGSGPDYKRYSFRVNTETHVGRLKFGENLFMMRSDEHSLFDTRSINLPGNRPSLVNDLLQAAPTIPLYDPNREGGFGGADQVLNNSITLNVPGINSLIKNSTIVNRVLADAYGEFTILDGLTYRLNLAYDDTKADDEVFVPMYDLGYFFPNPTAQYVVGNRSYSSFLVENTLNYTKKLGKNSISLLVGQTYQDFPSRTVRTTGTGLQKPYILSLQSASTFSVSDFNDHSSVASLLGRLNYSYDDKYLLTVNLRRDASSRFAPENNSAVFPSLGVAWKIDKDFALPEFISELKLRGGVGKVGNQQITNYAYQSVINQSIPYEFGNGRVLGAATTILVDPSIKWETRTTRSVGLDASMLTGKLQFTVEYYSNTSTDVLLDLPIPLLNGSLGNLTTNAGSIKNSGIEFSAEYHKQFGDFSLDLMPNFYTVHNEILDTGPEEYIAGAGARNQVGHPIGEHFGWVYEGIFQNASEINSVGPGDPGFDNSKHAFQSPGTAPGDIIFKDLDSDGVITDDDRTFLGDGMPTYYYGLNVTAGYKGFDFTLFFSGSGGNLINSNLYRGLMPTSSFTNWHEDILNHWTPENTNTDIPRVVWLDPNNNQRDSDRPGWLQKGDYLRINTLSLGYSLPSAATTKIGLNSVRLYVTLQNLHTFAAYKGYNPDFQSGILNPGFDYGTYPRPVTTMFGAQLKF